MNSSNKFICAVACANVMTAPNHKCELHSQLLFGDVVELIQQVSTNWSKVKLLNSELEAYILTTHLEALHSIETDISFIVKDSQTYFIQNGTKILLPIGSLIHTNTQQAIVGNPLKFASERFSNEEMQGVLNLYFGAPYMWGGNTIFGIDCSGLVQQLYRFYNIMLPHIASEQMEWGEVVDFIQDVKFGDLAFFTNEEGIINHVGIMLDASRIIHSSESNGDVAIDSLDNEGIVNARTQKRTHQLRIIKRILTN